jgi:hypothetical protein
VVVLYATPTAPLPSALTLLAVIITMLKQHSYVMTNYAMYREHVARYGDALLGVGAGTGSGVVAGGARPQAAGSKPATAAATAATAAPALSAAGLRRRKRKAAKAAAAGGAGAAGDAGRSGDPDADDDNDDDTGVDGGDDASPVAAGTGAAQVGGAGNGGMRIGFAPAAPTLGSPLAAAAAAAGSASHIDHAGTAPTGAPSSAAGPAHPVAVGADIIGGSQAHKRRAIRQWPENITLSDYAYFLAVPTLVYEPRYPRTKAVRWGYVARKCGEGAVCVAIQYVLWKQFMWPVLGHPTPPLFGGGSHVGAAAALGFDMMKLAIPSFMVWLAGFYLLFGCFCNGLAEVLRFADRQFYLAWWNA